MKNDIKKIHFVGIGGIGISAIAKFLLQKGHLVSGSDIATSALTAELTALGARVTTPHNADAINAASPDLVVHSAAIKPTNEELVRARELGIAVQSRKELLADLLREMRVYAVAGAHGKSTTSAMLSAILGGNAIIGAIAKEFGSNMRFDVGTNEVVFEADESDSSFLNANPHLAIVTNAEPEHMEHYGFDLARFYGAYEAFLQQARVRVLNDGDEFLARCGLDAVRLRAGDIRDVRTKLNGREPYTQFRLRDLGEFEVYGLGEHIATDAALAVLGALAVRGAGAVEEVRNNLRRYKGTKKRFDVLVTRENYALVDDYGHHPTEIAASLQSARLYAQMLGLRGVTAVFQPHRFTRLKANLAGFKAVFAGVRLVVLPVYAAGEEDNGIDVRAEFCGDFGGGGEFGGGDFNGATGGTFSRRVWREGEFLRLESGEVLDSGVVIGFGAGDISDMLRGLK